MKRVLSLVVCLFLATGAFAQSLGSRFADVDVDFELGDSPFSVAPLSYVYFGFNGLINAESYISEHVGLRNSQQFGINLAEIAFKPAQGVRASLGVDFSACWFRLGGDYMWAPFIYAPKGARYSLGANGHYAVFGTKESFGVQEVKKSLLSVYTIGIPLTVSYTMSAVTMALGGTLEVNLDGFVRFKGVDTGGNVVNEMLSGTRHSNKIGVNRITFNVHAAVSYGGLGLFFKYNPMCKFYKGVINGVEEECGPQFQTWTVGLIMGLGF